MEAGHSAAGDGHEQSGEHITQRSAAGCQGIIEPGKRGHIHGGGAADDAHDSQDHHAVQQEGAQVVTGLQQDPHGGDGSNADVQTDNDHPHGVVQIDGMPVQADDHADHDADDADDRGNAQRRVAAIDKEAEDDGHQDEHDGDDGGGGIGSGSRIVHSAVSGIGGLEGVGHDGGEGRHHQDQGQVSEGDKQLLGLGTDGVADDLTDGLALVANGGEQGAEVMHAAEEDTADQDPQHNGDPTEHSGLNGAVDGAGTGDRGEMVTHQHGSLGRTIILAILHGMGRSRTGVIHAPLLGQPAAVEDITYDQDSAANDKEQRSIHTALSFLNSDFFCL